MIRLGEFVLVLLIFKHSHKAISKNKPDETEIRVLDNLHPSYLLFILYYTILSYNVTYIKFQGSRRIVTSGFIFSFQSKGSHDSAGGFPGDPGFERKPPCHVYSYYVISLVGQIFGGNVSLNLSVNGPHLLSSCLDHRCHYAVAC